ncbi:MAG: hypothetical protein ACXWWU_00795 [Candidatus Limnocylindria bacterium]
MANIRANPPGEGERSVLAYDGYLSAPDGVRYDAIFVEALESDGVVTVMAQRYRPGKMLRRFEAVGNAALLPTDGSKLAAR